MFNSLRRAPKTTAAIESSVRREAEEARKAAAKAKAEKPIMVSTEVVRAARVAALLGRQAGHIHARIQRINSQAADYATMRHLARTVQRYNLSQPLMAYADKGRTLSSMIPAIPAVESLQLVGSARRDARSRGALVGLRAALMSQTAAVESWLEETAGETDRFFDTVGSELEGLKESVTAARSRIPETADEAALSAATTLNISASARAESMTILADVLAQLAPIDIEALSSDADYRAQVKAALLEIQARLQPQSGMEELDGEIQDPDEGEVAEDQVDASGTLASLGYTPDVVSSLLDQADALLTALEGVTNQKAEFVAGLQATVDATPATEDEGVDYTEEVSDPIEAPGTGEEINAAPVTDDLEDSQELDAPAQPEVEMEPQPETPNPSQEDLEDGIDGSGTGGDDDTVGSDGEAPEEEAAPGDASEETGEYTLDDHREVIGNYVHILVCTVRCSVECVVGVLAAAEALGDTAPPSDVVVSDAGADVSETVVDQQPDGEIDDTTVTSDEVDA